MKKEIHNHNTELPYQSIIIRDIVEQSVIREIQLFSSGLTSQEALQNMKELIKLSKDVNDNIKAS